MIRSSKHILKESNNCKLELLEKLFEDYKKDLQIYIDLIWDEKLPLKKFLSTKVLPGFNCNQSWYKQTIYKHSSEIIRSNKAKKKTSKPIIKNISIILDQKFMNFLNTSNNSNYFNNFVEITLPYTVNKQIKYHLTGPSRKYKRIRLPIKYHKQSLKFKDWNRKNSIQLSKINGNFYITFFYEKQEPDLKLKGQYLGIDIGYKKLISTSRQEFLGQELEQIYENISKKKQGSKKFKQILIYRDNKINEVCNKLDLHNIAVLYIENLKNVKHKSKIGHRFMNKLQRWSYLKTINKLTNICEENGIFLEKVSPVYTSQECSNCGSIHKESRKGEVYKCIDCEIELDADYNASLNILHRGIYNSSTQENYIII